MRVLIYLEPHPIRGHMTHFADVGRAFAGLVGAVRDADVRIFGNAATLDAVAADHPEETKGRLVRPTASEDEAFRAELGEWDGRRIARWCELMAGEGIAARYEEILSAVWSRFPFDAVVYWGENGAVRRFAADMGLTPVAMELGFTRAPYGETLLMDTFGVAGEGMLARLTADELSAVVGREGLSAAEALAGAGEGGVPPAYASAFAPIPADIRERILPARRAVAFLPLQLADDANLLRHAPYRSLTEFVSDVVPRLADAGYLTIVKEHPASPTRIAARFENAAARAAVAPFGDSVLWLGAEANAPPNAQIFALSDLVVTLNSSAGFEALHHDKTVVVLGKAAYAPDGLFPDLDAAIAGTFDRAAYRQAVAELRRFCLDAYLLPSGVFRDPAAFMARLGFFAGLQGREPAETARALFVAEGHVRTTLRRARLLAGEWNGGERRNVEPALPQRAPERAIPGLWDPRLGAEYSAMLWRLSGATGPAALEAWLDEAWREPGSRARLLGRLGLFDAEHYRASYPDVAASGMDPIAHFALSGEAEARSPRPQIDLHAYREARGTVPDGRFMLAMLKEMALGEVRRRSASRAMPGLRRPVPGVAEPAGAAEIVRRLRLLSRMPDRAGFGRWLHDVRRDRARWCTALVRSGLFDSAHYARANPDVSAAGLDPLEHFLDWGQWEGRPPAPNLSLEPWGEVDRKAGEEPVAALLEALADAVPWDPEPHHQPLDAAERALADETRAALAALSKRRPRPIAVVAHCFYADLVPEILATVASVRRPFDLIVTLPGWGARRIRAAILEAHPEAVLCPLPNRGRDVGPFLAVLPALIERRYTAVLKLQTKKGFRLNTSDEHRRDLGDAWRRHAFDALAGSPAAVETVVDAFAADPALAMVGPARFLVSVRDYPARGMPPWYWPLFDLREPQPSDPFFAGSMFWVRPSALSALVTPGLALDAFPPEGGAANGTLAHDVERLFASVAVRAGQRIAAVERAGEGVRLVADPAPIEGTLSGMIKRLAAGEDEGAGALHW